ncbi:MAG TPA: hypothetical protein VIH46_01030 [Candidatus Acidoferrales bacterium]
MVNLLHNVLSAVMAFALPVTTMMANGLQTQPPPPNADTCPASSLLLTFDVYRLGELRERAPIWQLGNGPAFFFKSGMEIDADGAPNAYNADDTGLDHLYNAGQPGQWDGIVEDDDGNPLVQGPNDPFPGFYISCTALFDRSKHRSDPARFVDASQIPYIALPGDLAARTGARLGDLAFVYSEETARYSLAIFADIGVFGEGSIALADDLGIRSDARRGGSPAGISYVVFPGSGNGRPKSVDEIKRIGGEVLSNWGGAEKMLPCAGSSARSTDPQPEGNGRAATSAAEQPVSATRSESDAAAK